AEDLDAAIALAREYDDKVIVEAAIVGREIECGVLEYPDGRLEASLPAELHVPTGTAGQDAGSDPDDGVAFYDFDTKYLDDVTTFDLPARIPAEDTERLRELAIAAFRALDAEGLSR